MAATESPQSLNFTAKGLATRERILQAAAQVVLSEGLTGFSHDLVRRQAGISGSQISHYFVDKPALIRAVLERQIEVVLNFHRQAQLGGLDTFDDWERWAQLNLRYLRTIGYDGTPTYHTLAGQLAKSDAATRDTLADGYWRWVDLLEESFQRMKDRGVLVAAAEPRELAMVVVAGHQGLGTLTFAFRQEWPLSDGTRFVVNHLRLYAADPAEKSPRPPRRPRTGWTRHAQDARDGGPNGFSRKGLATRARIVEGAAELIFEQGLHSTSLKDVRGKVGVSGSQLSHYFADKRDLTREVIAARTADVLDFHTQPALGELSSLKDLQAWADACVKQVDAVYVRGGCIYGSLAGELLEADEAVLDDLAAGYARWIGLFRKGLTTMRERGELVADADPRHLAVALLIAHQGGTMLSHATGNADWFRITVGAALDYVFSFRAPTKRAARRAGSRTDR
ncbi:TetR/AcrR family transcriptional regulator [Mycobacterium sp. 21AC1]|uniref:TetR/AcrR family transcriptional regulator n=1 Tax=[Mycobacterium] appelbergii TaxID=2939269 RepID=UPI002938E2EB|nr:TetR/AcrR family transcriptional regulator [Mycobacterium sp. 21AC1]MDV3123645.1 TetR/AcrR family transcriptional regulator [Mycobacterium sp. 21AC1]